MEMRAAVRMPRSGVRNTACYSGARILYDADKDMLAPARTAVEYEKQMIVHNLTDNTKYRGPPRPEQDEAWEALLECT
jgi:hypothetical protein